MAELGEWSDIDNRPARNQTGATFVLRILGVLCIAGGIVVAIIQGQNATAPPWIWAVSVGGGILYAIPLLILARVFDYLSFLSARLHRLTKAEQAPRKDAA